MPETNPSNPLVDFRFSLLVGGTPAGMFSRVSGIGGISVQAIEYREGGAPDQVRKLPGRTSYEDLVCEYGVGTYDVLWNQLMATVGGTYERKEVAVLLLKPDGTNERMRFTAYDAWVREARIGPLNALSNQVLIETLVLAVGRWERT